MRRGSLVGPILLILAGGLFLLNNLRPELPLLKIIGDYWPFVLIGWGTLRLIEVLAWSSSGRPLPASSVSGGEWMIVLLMCLVGTASSAGSRITKDWPQGRFTMHGLDMLGESFDFPLAEQKLQAGKTPRIVVENLRGNVRIAGADVEEVKASGRATVRAFQKNEAEQVSSLCPLEVVRRGDLIVVRTNQEKANGPIRISSEVEITVPRGASIEGHGRLGDFDISEIGGSLDVTSDNSDVRLTNLGGPVRLDLKRSSVIRAVNVKQSVEVKGSGQDVELEGIEGTSTITGSYSGDLIFRKLGKALHFQGPTTDLRLARVPGQVRMGRGDLSAANIVGPIVLKTGSKDVELNDFTDTVDITVNRGDIELRPGKAPVSAIEARTRAGNISLALPPGARFQMNATAERGQVVNDYGGALEMVSQNHGARLSGTVGGGPTLTLNTTRGEVTVRKSTDTVASSEKPKDSSGPIHLEVEKE